VRVNPPLDLGRPRMSTCVAGPSSGLVRIGWKLWHAAKRRPIDAHYRAIALRIEPIHGRVDEHPFVPVVVDQDYAEAFAKLKVLFLDASRAAGEAAEIPFVWPTDIEIEPDVRSAVRVGSRIIIRIVHGLRFVQSSVRTYLGLASQCFLRSCPQCCVHERPVSVSGLGFVASAPRPNLLHASNR
jgi:hypothetical protein